MNTGMSAEFWARNAGQRPADQFRPRPVLAHEVIHDGAIWDVVADDVDLGHTRVRREYLAHPSAVAVIAVRPTPATGAEQVLLIRQYRHPVRADLWEPPAGLLDFAGEDLAVAAARELAEEADLVAEGWEVLVDYFTSPGGSDEGIRIFLATGVADTGEVYQRCAEEADIETGWFDLDLLVAGVLGGRLHNPSTVVGVLALAARRAGAGPDR